jgi:ribose 5-phosphate isomerase B
MLIMQIAIGCDHAGFSHKAPVIAFLHKAGYTVLDFGTNSTESVDYPDFAHQVATAVQKGEAQFGIVLCGSGNGVAITVNQHVGLRCALCWKTELAKMARAHNDANALSIPARYVSKRMAIAMVKVFLETSFEGGRHATRVQKISC